MAGTLSPAPAVPLAVAVAAAEACSPAGHERATMAGCGVATCQAAEKAPAPEAEEGARCAMNLRPFDDSEKFEEEPMATIEVKVCDVGVSRVMDPNPQGTAEGARVACEEKQRIF